jgi:hypothetical protein
MRIHELVRLAMSSAKQGLLLGSLQLVLLGLYLGHVRYEEKPHDVNSIWPSKYHICHGSEKSEVFGKNLQFLPFFAHYSPTN